MSGVKHDSVDDKDFALPKNKKLKLHDDQDLGDNSHHLPVPMSCDDDPKVAKNDNSLKPNADLFSEHNVVLFSEDEAKQLFTNWCHEVGRNYYTKEEYSLRFNRFRETLEYVTHQKNKVLAEFSMAFVAVAVVVVVAKNDNSLKPNADLFSKDQAQTLFAKWCSKFGRIYLTQEEFNHRFNIFKENLEKITHLQNQGFPCDLTDFSDWAEEETLKLFCRCSDSESDTEQDHIQERHADKSFVSEKALDYDDVSSEPRTELYCYN
ncbi:hypothetical protein P8452_61546 [Trifolium repens]|nr:hypothetical protein P8452_61546 [Trifolium repens]